MQDEYARKLRPIVSKACRPDFLLNLPKRLSTMEQARSTIELRKGTQSPLPSPPGHIQWSNNSSLHANYRFMNRPAALHALSLHNYYSYQRRLQSRKKHNKLTDRCPYATDSRLHSISIVATYVSHCFGPQRNVSQARAERARKCLRGCTWSRCHLSSWARETLPWKIEAAQQQERSKNRRVRISGLVRYHLFCE